MPRYFILLLIFSLGTWVQGQQIVQDIKLEGIKKNDESYLRRFIQSKQNEVLDENLFEQDIQQLRRRTGVANAELIIDTLDNNNVTLRFQIQEQRTLLPQVGIGGIQDNFWWQVGIEEHNLFGKGQTLIANYLHNDRRPNFKVFYQNEWINGTPWGFSADANHTASIEPLYFSDATVSFKYSNTGAGLLGLRYLGFNRRISLGVNFFVEEYEKERPEDFGTTPGPDVLKQQKLLLKANYRVNRVSYDYFYRTGMEWDLLAQSVTTITDGTQFLSLAFEGKKYWRPYPTANIAIRLRAAVATNRPSPFAPFVLDSRVNIRGVGNRVDRGTAQFVLNAEFRQTIFHTARWGGQVVVFSDAGTWRNPGGDFLDLLDKDQFRQFVGGGIRFINKKVFKSTLRLDIGFDLWNAQQSGVVFGVGQYF